MKKTGVVDRLRRMTGEDKQKPEKTTDANVANDVTELRRRIEAIMARRPMGPQERPQPGRNYPALEEVIRGEEITTAEGAFFLATERRDGPHAHGNRFVADLVGIDMEAAGLLANAPAIVRCRISEGLFLDTETTGLAGGTGTLAFMIGLGWFEEESFVTRQLFIRDFAEERAALSYLAGIAATKKFLVSFNGKAFDVNLLAARFIMNRFRNPLKDLPHLDLLFPSRRLCGHRLENSRLVTLEQALFGLYRDDDIPGAEIPARYFSWLRRRDPRLVVDIFRHNHLDIISLAALTAHLAELVGPGPAPPVRQAAPKAATDPRDLLAAARLLHDRNEATRACGILQDLTACNHADLRYESQRMLSLIFKRKGDWTNAARLWETMLAERPDDLFAAVELAKWHEHRRRDFQAALDLVSRMLERLPRSGENERAALEHRLRRLQSRLSPDKN